MNRSADRKRQHPLTESIILFIAKLLIRAGLVFGAWQFRCGAGRLTSRNVAGLCLNAIYFLAYALGAAVRALQNASAGSETPKIDGFNPRAQLPSTLRAVSAPRTGNAGSVSNPICFSTEA